MKVTDAAYEVLLIDDRQDQLAALAAEVEDCLPPGYRVSTWTPHAADDDETPLDALDRVVNGRSLLVATDYDLSTSLKGFFGSAVVAWCQARFIPVCNFSKGTRIEAFTEPGLFDIVIDPAQPTAARIAQIAQGFAATTQRLSAGGELSSFESPAAALVQILQAPANEADLAPYFARLGSANRSLLNELRSGQDATPDRQLRLMSYILGHVMLNGILAYPGPILSAEALAAYCATSINSERQNLLSVFEPARFSGPFSTSDDYYWRVLVDDRFDVMPVERREGEAFDQTNRRRLEEFLQRPLDRHSCDREGCDGLRGGFFCPFKRRPVCDREDCSVSATGWIPGGADLSRIERDFYDEWAPLLGY